MLTKHKKILIVFFICIAIVVGTLVLCLSLNNDELKQDDFDELKQDEYSIVNISMWDMSSLDSDWYELYFGSPIKYTKYQCKSLDDVCDYLDVCFNSENVIEKVYINIDGYDSKIANKIDKLTGYLTEYTSTEFLVLLPVQSISEYDNFTIQSENIKKIVEWGNLYENCKIRWMGDIEWLIANRLNFDEEGNLKEDIFKLEYIYLYGFDDFNLSSDNVDEHLKTLESLLDNYKQGQYDRSSLENAKLVFLGDSVFARPEQATLSIAGVISSLTGASYYNLAVSGSTACYKEKDSFVSKINGIENNIDIKKDDQTVFLINYGFNDYFSGVKISNDDDPYDTLTYGGALRYGIKVLKDEYPNASIVLVTPYVLGVANGGNDAYTEGGSKLSQYVEEEIEICQEENIYLINMYESSGITFENSSKYLVDCVHPTLQTNFDLAEIIAGKLENICKGK